MTSERRTDCGTTSETRLYDNCDLGDDNWQRRSENESVTESVCGPHLCAEDFWTEIWI
jgi:hypothetical protein